MPSRALRLLILGLLALTAGLLGWLVLAGRGGASAPGGSSEEARGSVGGTVTAALAALGRLDRPALVDLLTPLGRAALDSDLTLFGAGLADPVRGPRLLAKVRERWPEVPDALVEGARQGRLEDIWTLFLRATTPTGVTPRQAGMRLNPARPDEAEVLYRYGDGPELPIRLVRLRGRWHVDHLTLGSS